MRVETIFEMLSPCRDNFRITGYRFGEGAKTLAIVGAMRGDEVQQQYICAQVVNRLAAIEQNGGIAKRLFPQVVRHHKVQSGIQCHKQEDNQGIAECQQKTRQAVMGIGP